MKISKELVNLRLIQEAQCPGRGQQELRNVESISNYDAISLGSVRYAKDKVRCRSPRAAIYSTTLTPRLGEELAGNIATT